MERLTRIRCSLRLTQCRCPHTGWKPAYVLIKQIISKFPNIWGCIFHHQVISECVVNFCRWQKWPSETLAQPIYLSASYDAILFGIFLSASYDRNIPMPCVSSSFVDRGFEIDYGFIRVKSLVNTSAFVNKMTKSTPVGFLPFVRQKFLGMLMCRTARNY